MLYSKTSGGVAYIGVLKFDNLPFHEQKGDCSLIWCDVNLALSCVVLQLRLDIQYKQASKYIFFLCVSL